MGKPEWSAYRKVGLDGGWNWGVRLVPQTSSNFHQPACECGLDDVTPATCPRHRGMGVLRFHVKYCKECGIATECPCKAKNWDHSSDWICEECL